jgi:hypothetical protein
MGHGEDFGFARVKGKAGGREQRSFSPVENTGINCDAAAVDYSKCCRVGTYKLKNST